MEVIKKILIVSRLDSSNGMFVHSNIFGWKNEKKKRD